MQRRRPISHRSYYLPVYRCMPSLGLFTSNTEYQVVSLKERPDLRASYNKLSVDSWPKFFELDPQEKVEDILFKDWSQYQVAVLSKAGKLLGIGLSVPLFWDGSLHTLPSGWEAAKQKGIEDLVAGKTPTAITAFAILVDKMVNNQGMSGMILQAMLNMTRSHGFHSLMSCARPILKVKYPLIPIEQYAYWTNAFGEPFDPWVRLHWRLGAKLVGVSPLSSTYQGTVSQWEKCTNMKFPASGQYIINDGLTPLIINREQNFGTYYDPNVWMLFRTSSATT
ncbi:unnamed protein product [Adineta ricciae]|uniref:Uncharacterized protein n=1 Tax=Adineta ricciae TaxID=249248 RepID=A0A814JXC6_ADIRI|nr:unnamed protein product [Adineta ricciae]